MKIVCSLIFSSHVAYLLSSPVFSSYPLLSSSSSSSYPSHSSLSQVVREVESDSAHVTTWSGGATRKDFTVTKVTEYFWQVRLHLPLLLSPPPPPSPPSTSPFRRRCSGSCSP